MLEIEKSSEVSDDSVSGSEDDEDDGYYAVDEVSLGKILTSDLLFSNADRNDGNIVFARACCINHHRGSEISEEL